jgi:methyl-accepting chemotaxis protein
MNKNDLKNPLIQSGAILLVVFLLISIVANSEPDGFLGSISGLASGLLFIIGLFLAIIISIAIIIGLFIAAVSIHSVDKARDLSRQLKETLINLWEKLGGGSVARLVVKQDTAGKRPTADGNDAPDARHEQLARQVASLHTRMQEQQSHLATAATSLAALQHELSNLQQSADEESPAPAHDHQEMAEQLQGIAEKLDGLTTRIDTLERRLDEQLNQLTGDIDELREKTALPDVVAGILSYIDRPEDRELITSKAEEAVARGMTYAQIDEFFKSSLSPEVFEVLESHPRLTKDFIRSVKKRFE